MRDQLFHHSASGTLHIYQAGGNADREQGNQPMTEWQSQTLSSFLWGVFRQDLCITNCSLGDGTRTGIEEIKIEWSLLQRLVTLLTLGLWSPLRISWRGAKLIGPRGLLE